MLDHFPFIMMTFGLQGERFTKTEGKKKKIILNSIVPITTSQVSATFCENEAKDQIQDYRQLSSVFFPP